MLAAIAGYSLMGVLVASTDVAYGARLPGQYYFPAVLFTDTLYSLAGGWLCAWIARDGRSAAIILMMAFGETLGIGAQVMERGKPPLWFVAGLLIGYPSTVWLGSKLVRKNRM